MTSKQSIFNKGIYKLTIKRFKWGAVLYFFLLFMMTCFPVFTQTDWYSLFESGLPILYILTAMVVPAVVALLIFRSIHNSKQTVFMHSIPVTRKCLFFSSILGGMTLMFAPVILNGILLMLLRINHSAILHTRDIFIWVLINIAVLFIMFSIASLAAVLTGNSFMSVFLYGAIQLLPLGLYAIIYCIGTTFIYGYWYEAAVPEFIINHTPFIWIMDIALGLPESFSEGYKVMIVYVVMAVILYLISAFIYNIRKSERAGDMTSFRILNPILKYTLTFMATVFMLYITISTDSENILYILFFTVLIAFVTYFICEMVLKKSVKVFRSYKGFIAFTVITAALLTVISATGFFGYSSYIPNEIKGVSIYSNYQSYYSNNGYTENKDAIKYINGIHKEILENKTYICNDNYDYLTCPVIIEYSKPNGKTVKRAYKVDSNKYEEYIATMYDNYEDFRTSYNPVLSKDFNIDDIISVYFNDYGSGEVSDITLYSKKDIKTFYGLYASEAEKLSYNNTYGIADTGYVLIEAENNTPYNIHINLPLTVKFEKTHKWLVEQVKEQNDVEEPELVLYR